MRYYVVLFIIFTAFYQLKAQTISGYVTDKHSGEKLIGANIYCPQQGIGIATNKFGFYSLQLITSDTSKLNISYIGYDAEILTISKNDTIINVELKSNTTIDEVVVIAQQSIENRTEMSVAEIPMKQLKTLPMLAGEVDIIKAMQLMPGIKSGSEGMSAMLVRGGSHDQNLILLDDVPLYYINHLGGFVSVFNTDAINSIKLYKGGFPARYGSRLSSIMDVRMKDGNIKKRQTSITIGMISCKFQTEGPIKKDTSSYMISARRFMYDLISRPLTWLTNNKHSKGYTFYDLNAKLNYKFSDNDRLFFSFYTGQDKIISQKKETDKYEKDVMKNNSKWGNLLLATRWNHMFSPRFFSNVTANYTKYRYNSNFSFLSEDLINSEETFETSYDFFSQIDDYGLKSDFEYHFSNYTMRFGSNHIYHTFKPNITHVNQTGFANVDSSYNVNKYNTLENSVYLENDFSISKYLNFNIGLRGVSYSIDGMAYYNIEPRLLLNINIPNLFSIKGAYSKMQQYVHLLTYSGGGMPADLWMPTTENIAPEKAEQYALGVAKSFLNNSIELSIEGYVKNISNLIAYKEGVGYAGSSTDDWEQLVETDGIGKSKGIELLLQKKQGRFNGWVAYTLSQSTRQFDNINNGKEYLFTYDATHDFSITGNYYFKKNLYGSLTWIYTTGRAITMSNEVYKTLRLVNYSEEYPYNIIDEPRADEIPISTYSDKNNIRMNPYHRLDLGLTYIQHRKKSERIWNFSIYNAYNRQNAYYYYTTSNPIEDANGNETGAYNKQTYQRSLFPFIPSVSYTIKF